MRYIKLRNSKNSNNNNKNRNIRNWSDKKRGHFRTVTFKLLKKRVKEGKKVKEITNA